MHKILFVVSVAASLLLANIANAASASSGKTSYANNCASCHSVPSAPWNLSTASIQSAIQGNRGGMGGLSALTLTELQDIVVYLADPVATTVTATTTGTTDPTSTVTPGTTTSTTCSATSDDDDELIFDWSGTQSYGSRTPSQNILGYRLTFYPAANVYLGTRDGQLYFYDVNRPEDGVLDLGATRDWSSRAAASGTRGRCDDGNDDDGESHETHETDPEAGDDHDD